MNDEFLNFETKLAKLYKMLHPEIEGGLGLTPETALQRIEEERKAQEAKRKREEEERKAKEELRQKQKAEQEAQRKANELERRQKKEPRQKEQKQRAARGAKERAKEREWLLGFEYGYSFGGNTNTAYRRTKRLLRSNRRKGKGRTHKSVWTIRG